MATPHWPSLDLNEGVLREPTEDDHPLVLWLPGDLEGGFLYWERVRSVPGAAVTVEQGVCAIPATSIRARQRIRGTFGKFFRFFRKAAGEEPWDLPNGEVAEPWGERQTDLILVWAEEGANLLDETQIRSRWPQAKRFQKIGKNLFLVAGIESQGPRKEPAPARPLPPGEQANRLLAAARKTGDRPREASALTDLGIVWMRSGDPRRAVVLLEEALALARSLGDLSREGDILGNLGLAMGALGQAGRALELLEQALAYARAAGDRFAEKTALANQGIAYSGWRDPARALASYEQALALAREVGDRSHEADLLWYMAIQYAELNQRDQVGAAAEAAVDLFEKMGHPQAGLFKDHWQRYHRGEAGPWVAGSAWAPPTGPGPMPEQPAGGPGLLRMAMSAAKAMAKFVGSGLKAAPSETYEKRLRTCAACEHHTGTRCKLCGCFTSVKAWMPHEKCPIGKWPA